MLDQRDLCRNYIYRWFDLKLFCTASQFLLLNIIYFSLYKSCRFRDQTILTEPNRHQNQNVTKYDEPKSEFMEKLGYTNSTLVKTTTHVHPVMNNLSMGAGPPSDLMKKATTSPASTLSDKGIGENLIIALLPHYRYGNFLKIQIELL